MSRKRTGSIPTVEIKEDEPMTIDMNEINRKKQHGRPAFRSGRYMTEKDRPRKKNWKKEYKNED